MYRMLLASILLMTSATATAVRADDCARASASDLAAVEQWIQKFDPVLDQAAFRDNKEDFITPYGAAIDRSCFEGVSGQVAQRRTKRLTSALSIVLSNTLSCQKRLAVPELARLIPIARRLVIICEDLQTGSIAKARLTYDEPLLEGFGMRIRNPFERGRIAGHDPDRRYAIRYNVNPNGPGALDSEEDSTMRIASTIFHESLHFLTENRSWHGEIETRNGLGCVDSVFEDRIYFVEAACMPAGEAGRYFFDRDHGAAGCPEVCMRALTEVDAGIGDKYSGLKGTPPLATPLDPAEARKVCDNVRRYRP